jgi:hypothetical protein
MLLMDSIIYNAHMVRKTKSMDNYLLGIFPILERKLKGCPRFLFDHSSIHTAVELTLGRPKVLREAMEHLIIPYSKLWVEWPEAGRQKLRDTFNTSVEEPGRPLPTRLGFLLEADETGRKGEVTWAWSNRIIDEEGEPPNVCPISPYFDLDSNFKQSDFHTMGFLDANLANQWKHNPIQLNALMSIWNTAHHRPSDWGNTYLAQSLNFGFSTKQSIANFYADVYGEYIMVWSVLMLLTSSKKILDLKPIDHVKLNVARHKKGRSLLLDHTVVSLHINKEIYIHQKGMPLGHNRKSPRIHMVSSYLARRGDKHWIVQPYWRGSGEVISRHVHVKK